MTIRELSDEIERVLDLVTKWEQEHGPETSVPLPLANEVFWSLQSLSASLQMVIALDLRGRLPLR